MKKQIQGLSLILIAILLVLIDMADIWTPIMKVIEVMEDIINLTIDIDVELWWIIIHLLGILGLVLIFKKDKTENKEDDKF